MLARGWAARPVNILTRPLVEHPDLWQEIETLAQRSQPVADYIAKVQAQGRELRVFDATAIQDILKPIDPFIRRNNGRGLRPKL